MKNKGFDFEYPVITTVSATPSLNQLHSNKWSMLNWKKKYLKELKNYDVIYGLKSPQKIYLTYHRYGSREFDNDNFVGGCKPLTDALKNLRVIWDDRPEFVDIKYAQFKCKRGEEKTIIFISKNIAEFSQAKRLIKEEEEGK